MASHVARGHVPGFVTLIARGGEVRADAMGTQAVGGGGPVRRDTIFRISSMTKPIAAVAAMILVEDGKLGQRGPSRSTALDLNDPAEGGDPGEKRVAILMTQCSAFPLTWDVYRDFWTAADEANEANEANEASG
jgi:hypothetical protein